MPIIQQLSPHLFWDVNLSTLDEERSKKFIIKKVLEYGLWEDWLLIKKEYGVEQIAIAAMGFRDLDPKSLAFISVVADIPKENFRCYSTKPSTPKHWNF